VTKTSSSCASNVKHSTISSLVSFNKYHNRHAEISPKTSNFITEGATMRVEPGSTRGDGERLREKSGEWGGGQVKTAAESSNKEEKRQEEKTKRSSHLLWLTSHHLAFIKADILYGPIAIGKQWSWALTVGPPTVHPQEQIAPKSHHNQASDALGPSPKNDYNLHHLIVQPTWTQHHQST